MKPSHSADFRVRVRPEEVEQAAELADLYRGIYHVTLNDVLDVLFVPALDRSAPWPPVLPNNVDQVASEAEARRLIVGLESYVVTPDDQRAGTEELINQGSERGVIFYVTSDEFASFVAELQELAAQLPGFHTWRPISELREWLVARFLLERFAASPKLAPNERRVLGR